MSVLGVKKRPQGTFDSDLVLDAGHSESTSGTIYGRDAADAAIVLDLGTGLFRGTAVIDVTAIDVAQTDNIYTFSICGSGVAAFDNTQAPLASLAIGHATAIVGKTGNNAAGRYKIVFDNEYNGTFFRYVRLQLVMAGTSDDIDYSAYIIPSE